MGPLALGLHKKGKYYEVVAVDGCNIIDKDFTLIRQIVTRYFQELKQLTITKGPMKDFKTFSN